MGKNYKNTPIIEALCEFRLTKDTHWDLIVPGLFYEKVKDTYPEREQRMIQEFELAKGPQSLQQRIGTSERSFLFAPDRKTLIQVGPHLLVVNILKPYPNWQQFKQRIQKAWSSLQEVVEIRGLERIGLRYINQIEFPTQDSMLEEYLEFYPFIGKKLPKQKTSFIVGSEFSYEADRDRCRVQLMPSIGNEKMTAVFLDIDYFLARSRGLEVSAALSWVEEAHNRVEEVFEGCITDKLRIVLGGV
ncbi:TIGR04255 family protein [Methylacidiphilum caldifontis]|uniref:TIGR04255 family protein n=1 Tax=Methylacidiphilum caldifontis TaxID=2795386 RepID=A0A4Y8PGJ3_9BACT|nr:TIGR04255 family protein [Methylacidiphilum caldifontis]QSR88497.1 TIGR04255 family protein [Methylacidiphilum caldifontis]TFE71323.1 hypothetical protein A7Q10_04955 [Methylacidiphilum caldifontis]